MEAGLPHRAPPQRLEDCQRSVIEGALAQPFAGIVDREFYPGLAAKAAVLLYTLSKSQACDDGNKRVALILVEAFVALNGRTLDSTSDEIADRVIAAAESDASERADMLDSLTRWLADSLVPL